MNCTQTITLSDEQIDDLALLPGGECLEDGHGSFRCDLTHDHPGRHVTLADVCALDSEPIGSAPWLWWNDAGHELVIEPGCGNCPLPAGHPQGSGCSNTARAHCGARVHITNSERDHLENLPDAAHSVDPEQLHCELAPGHGDQHCTLGQSQDHSTNDSTNWWIVWQSPDGQDHTITTAPDCPALPPHGSQEPCLHIHGHQGPHTFD